MPAALLLGLVAAGAFLIWTGVKGHPASDAAKFLAGGVDQLTDTRSAGAPDLGVGPDGSGAPGPARNDSRGLDPGEAAAQVAALVTFVGLTGKPAVMATAIALCESGGDPNAVGDGGQSIGLWQIHMPSHPGLSKAQLLDPLTNARAMLQISRNGTDWEPWSCCKFGGYARQIQAAQNAVRALAR